MYEYRASVLRVVDGDTLDMSVDLGFRVYQQMRLRLLGVDTPERGQPGYAEAMRFVEDWVWKAGVYVLVETRKDKADKYGRYLAVVRVLVEAVPTQSLNDALLGSGLAVEYEGGTRTPAS